MATQHPIERYLLSQPGMTETAFAKLAQVNLTNLSRVLRGHRDRLCADACLRISKATHGKVTVEELLSWKSTEEQRTGRFVAPVVSEGHQENAA